MEFYERVSGADYILHTSDQVGFPKTARWIIDDIYMATQFGDRIDEVEELCTDNRIWKDRTIGVGVVSEDAFKLFIEWCDVERFWYSIRHS